jgi:hypothetical protein
MIQKHNGMFEHQQRDGIMTADFMRIRSPLYLFTEGDEHDDGEFVSDKCPILYILNRI